MVKKEHFECLMQLKALLEFHEMLQHIDSPLTFNETNNLYGHLEQQAVICLDALGITDDLTVVDDA
jgi:hypothetical protein